MQPDKKPQLCQPHALALTLLSLSYSTFSTLVTASDTDGDGLCDAHELINGTDPNTIDRRKHTILGKQTQWAYRDDGVLIEAWNDSNFDDSSWNQAAGHLGFGDGDETVTLNSGSTTYYFRASFDTSEMLLIEDVSLRIKRDDGAIIYLNGVEMFRSNMPEGEVNQNTRALTNIRDSDEDTYQVYTIPTALLLPGSNCLAVEIHQFRANNSDLSFELELSAQIGSGSPIQSLEYAQYEAIGMDAVWSYLDTGAAASDWADMDFDASGWSTGPAEFGFGNGTATTVLADDQTTYYFRKKFSVEDLSVVDFIRIQFICDDGAALYINGNEIARDNLPTRTLTDRTRASNNLTDEQESLLKSVEISAALLQQGDNFIAVEVHQARRGDDDLSFALALEIHTVSEIILDIDCGGSSGIFSGQLDGDNDGIGDTWEVTYYGNLLTGPDEDSDGDGFSTLEEFRANTDPLDPNSKLHLLIEHKIDGQPYSLRLNQTSTERRYILYYSRDLSEANSWKVVPDIGLLNGNNANLDVLVSAFADTNIFFQVRVELP